jgi:hypothetical protein
MVITAELFAHRRSGNHTEAKKHKIKERERPYQEFYFKRKRVCRKTKVVSKTHYFHITVSNLTLGSKVKVTGAKLPLTVKSDKLMNISSVSGPYRPITPYVKPFFTPQLCSQP